MAKKSDLKQDVNFIFEIGTLRYIQRMWHRFGGINFANLAEHHLRVFWIAMIIAEHEQGADTGKVGKLAMVHDITESRTGDVDYLSRQYVERNEQLGMEDMLAGTAIEAEFKQLWHEYEQRETLEAKIVKDADTVDVDFELLEQAAKGENLRSKWPMRANVADKLYTETAKRLFAAVQAADPHDWHLLGRNRHNDGDWRPGK